MRTYQERLHVWRGGPVHLFEGDTIEYNGATYEATCTLVLRSFDEIAVAVWSGKLLIEDGW